MYICSLNDQEVNNLPYDMIYLREKLHAMTKRSQVHPRPNIECVSDFLVTT